MAGRPRLPGQGERCSTPKKGAQGWPPQLSLCLLLRLLLLPLPLASLQSLLPMLLLPLLRALPLVQDLLLRLLLPPQDHSSPHTDHSTTSTREPTGRP